MSAQTVNFDELETSIDITQNSCKKVLDLWESNIDVLVLNCESVIDQESVFTDAAWRGKQLYLSRALGDIWSLPNKTCVFGHGTEVKNVVTLQVLYQQV